MGSIFIIAEAGINHNGDINVAREMIQKASNAKVDAIKFQSFTAAELASKNYAPDQYEFFKRFELSENDHRMLADECKRIGIEFMSTPFDFEKADMLERLQVDVFKIASCDLTNIPLIKHVAKKKKPMFISTGMGSLDETKAAYNAALDAGCPRAVMLHCTTLYPTPYSEANLLAILEMAEHFGGNVGFSDHTIGNYSCIAAAALGAKVIEKHFALDKSVEGPDIPGSCDYEELADLVNGIRAVEEALGTGIKTAQPSELDMIAIARRSIFSANSIPAGTVISEEMLAFRRPGDGIKPSQADEIIGKKAKAEIPADSRLDWDMLE